MQPLYPGQPGHIYHPGYGAADMHMKHMQQMPPPPPMHPHQPQMPAPPPGTILGPPPGAIHSQAPHPPNMGPGPGPRPTGNHPLLSDQFAFMRRPPALPEVRVRCARDEKCVKENGHRGRCSLQHKPREDDMLRLMEQVRTLQVELELVQGERDRLKNEVSTLWAKLSKACSLLSDIVRSKRKVRTMTQPSAEECQQQVRNITMQCLQDEAEEKREQFVASLALLESSMLSLHQPEERAARQAEIDTYKRQFEQDMHNMRAAHAQAAEANASELVPCMMMSQTVTATRK